MSGPDQRPEYTDEQRAVAAALYAAAEGLHYAATRNPTVLIRALTRRHDVADSVLHQIGAEEFARLVKAMADETCAYLRVQAEQAKQ